MSKKFVKSICAIILFFCFICNVFAYETIIIHPPENFGTGKDATTAGNCSPSVCPLYSARGHLGFRFTLVDYQGNKIPGTKSVDYTGSNDLVIVKDGINFYGYRYDMNLDSNYEKVTLITISGFPINASEFLKFMDSDFGDLRSEKYSYKKPDGTIQPYVSFINAFFHDSGLLEPNESLSKSKEKIANALIIIEPTVRWSYMIGNNTYYIYGTFSELSKYSVKIREAGNTNMFHSGMVPDLLHTRLCVTNAELKLARDRIGLGEDADFFVKNGAPYADCTVPGFYNQTLNLQYSGNQYYKFYEAHKDFLNTDYGFGVYLGLVPAELKKKTDDDQVSVESGLLSCDYNGGEISFKGEDMSKPQQYEELAVSSDDGIYCYDSNVLYDFSKMFSSLNRNNFNVLTYVNPDSGKLNVIRKCYVKNSSLIGDQPSKNLLQELEDDYKNQIATINLYGINYDIKPTNVKTKQMTENKNFDNSGGTLFTYELEADYDVERNSLFIGYDYKDNTNGTISLNNFQNAFGKSNDLLKNNTKIYINENEIVDKYDTKLDDKMKCNFNFGVKNPESEIRFRVISLENPFPGRDGTSRMPSKNWFYDENYVYDYIVNNRGIRRVVCDGNSSTDCGNNVSPEKMYSSVEPMYRITLTPSTMLKIREYNKNFSYYSMYDASSYIKYDEKGEKNDSQVIKEKDLAAKGADKLICDSTGRQCYSQFLRDSNYIPQDGDLTSGTFSGSCVLAKDSKNDETIRSALSNFSVYSEEKYKVADLYNYIYGKDNSVNSINKGLYDLNYNDRIDNTDLEILFQSQTARLANKGLNTSFYTCANKSYFSGGPIDVGGDD